MYRSLRLRRRQAMVLLVVGGTLYAVGFVFPVATQTAIDRIVSGRVGPFLIALAVLVSVAVAAEAALMRARQRLVVELATFIDRRIARMAFAHLMRARIDVASFRSGEMLNCFQQARKIQGFVLTDLPQAGFELGNFLVSLVVIFCYDWIIGIALLLVAPLIRLAVRAPIEGVRAASLASYEASAAQQNVLSEGVNAIATVKSLSFEGLRMRLWSDATDVVISKTRVLMLMQNRYVISTQSASRLINLMVVVIGGVQLIQHRITVGNLFALQVLGGRITAPIIFSSNVYNRYQEVDVAIGKMAAFLDRDRERASVLPPAHRFGAGGIVLGDVSLT